ncbi:hypothetical protein [Nocardiopsis sp. FR4]|uniref:hypothetical protein n=1 Tax=Nocardiopsis sp. FR4 TaxID=2605985 RepID=UPI0013570466|nr:hypothetical protein [Nocardiopsis sp. FR4]
MFDWWNTDLYLPQLLGAVVTGVLTGLVAAGVAVGTARHEIKQEKFRRWQEQRDRRIQEEAERAERAARDEEARRDALNRSVVASFVEACGKLQAALQEVDSEAIRTSSLWAESRAAQVRMLLHSEGKNDLLAWFHSQWREHYMRVADVVVALRGAYFPRVVNHEEVKKVHDEFLRVEHVCARWSTQALSEWTTDLPPAWLLASAEPSLDEGSEDRVE